MVEKSINDYIESIDPEEFSGRDFSTETEDLAKKVAHLSARNDMIGSGNCGNYVISKEFGDAILEYKKSVVGDLIPTFKDLSKTRFAS